MMLHPRRLASLAVLLAATFGSARAFADDAPSAAAYSVTPSAEAPAKTQSEWYGYQTLGVDGLALGVGALAPSSGAGFGTAAIVTYLVGAPVIHLVHGSPGKALGDLAIRAGAPVGGALIGGVIAALAAPRAEGFQGLTTVMAGMGYGLLAGVGIAVGIDAIVLARRDVAPAHETGGAPASARTSAPLRILPTFAPTANGASAGVVGSF